jgi:hypothetical protein
MQRRNLFLRKRKLQIEFQTLECTNCYDNRMLFRYVNNLFIRIQNLIQINASSLLRPVLGLRLSFPPPKSESV